MSRSRAKLFIENFLAYGLMNIMNKIIPFILLPVITRLLTDSSDFGIFDMYNLIVGFGSPLVMLGIYDAIFREYFEIEDQNYRYNVTATANRIILLASILISTILVVFNTAISKLFFGTHIHGIIIIYSAIEVFFTTNKQIISAPTRIQNKRTIYVFAGIIQSLLFYSLAILLISLGYSYFGMIIANIISSVLLFIFFWNLNKKFFLIGKYNNTIAKELLKIGVPLLPTFLIYWVFQSMDKIMISNMISTAELGIYSVGGRVASISSLIYVAFSGGWQYFAFSTMKDEDYGVMIGKLWGLLFVISSCFFIIVFFLKNIVFNTLFIGNYQNAVIVFPFLFFAPFLQMLFQILSTQFQVIKKTYYIPLILSFGVITNLILNYYLIARIGIKGAAIATLLSFAISLVIIIVIVVNIRKMVHFTFSTYIIIVFFTIVFITLVKFEVNYKTLVLGMIYILICILSYYKDIMKLLKKG